MVPVRLQSSVRTGGEFLKLYVAYKDVANVGRWGNGDVEPGPSKADALPFVMGLARQAFENQMGNGEEHS